MSESLYDEVIAPKLREIGELCQKEGMPFVALVEYEPGQCGRTEFTPETASGAMKIAGLAARCNGNFDALAFAASKLAGANTSVVLTRMMPTPESQ